MVGRSVQCGALDERRTFCSTHNNGPGTDMPYIVLLARHLGVNKQHVNATPMHCRVWPFYIDSSGPDTQKKLYIATLAMYLGHNTQPLKISIITTSIVK